MLHASNHSPSWSPSFLNHKNIGKMRASSWGCCGTLRVSTPHDSWLRELPSHFWPSTLLPQWSGWPSGSSVLSSPEKSQFSHSFSVIQPANFALVPELSLRPRTKSQCSNLYQWVGPGILQELLGKRTTLSFMVAELIAVNLDLLLASWPYWG